MNTAFLLLLSAALIGAGIGILWRDVHFAGRRAFAPNSDLDGKTNSNDEGGTSKASAGSKDSAGRIHGLGRKPANEPAGAKVKTTDPPGQDTVPPQATAQQWAALQPIIHSAVEQVNSVLAQADLTIGAADAPTLGMGKAYGASRLIEARGKAFAQLRLECTPAGRLKASLTAQDDRLAEEVNGDASTLASDASIGVVSDLLSECLKPATAYALRRTRKAGRATEGEWKTIEATVLAAMQVANGAILEAGARLVPISAPAWEPNQGFHRMPLSVQMFGRDIARMHIDLHGDEMEIAVGLPDVRLARLGRRQSLAIEGMTTHALAEAIAACAWPSIAHDRETGLYA